MVVLTAQVLVRDDAQMALRGMAWISNWGGWFLLFLSLGYG
jgi:hypothetical protein